MNVYIAAASVETERAEHWARRLIGAGIGCTSSWMGSVRAVGAANPIEASIEDRRRWAQRCLNDVGSSDALWLLVPPPGVSTMGACVEFGYATAHGQYVIASGDTRQSIFTALGAELSSDSAAFEQILAWAGVTPRAEVG